MRVGRTGGFTRPALGLGGAGLGPLGAADAERLRSIGLDHVRADLRLEAPGWEAGLERAVADARALDAPLELALFLPDDPRAVLRDLAGRAAALRPRVACWLLFASDGTTADGFAALAREALAGAFPAALFGGGTDGHFAELNRRRPSRTRARPARLRARFPRSTPSTRPRWSRTSPASARWRTRRGASRAGSPSGSRPSRCARARTRARPPRATRGSRRSPTTRGRRRRSRRPGRSASSPPPPRPASTR